MKTILILLMFAPQVILFGAGMYSLFCPANVEPNYERK